MISVVKVRSSQHSKDIRFFEIDDDGIRIAGKLSPFRGILTGQPSVIEDGAQFDLTSDA